MADDPKTLVSTDWLARHLDDPDLRVLDGSWYLPDMKRDGRVEYEAGHIPGARYADIDELSDPDSPLPHMAPSPERFVSRLRAMGVGDGHQVVVYDGAGLFSAARIWWLFRLMGKTDVAVLDGGLPKWLAEGRPVETGQAESKGRHLTVQPQLRLVRSASEVLAAVREGGHEILDARAAGRFRGEAPEPRPGLRSGHIPGSKSLPYKSLLNPDGTMLPVERLKEVFAEAGVDLSKPAITSCGSGVSAAVISLALERVGHRDHALYDGSWAEWGRDGDLPVATGEA